MRTSVSSFSNPAPPNHPSTFWLPWANITEPRARRINSGEILLSVLSIVLNIGIVFYLFIGFYKREDFTADASESAVSQIIKGRIGFAKLIRLVIPFA